MLKCDCEIQKFSVTKDELTITLKAGVTPGRVETLAELNGKGGLRLVLEIVQPELFDFEATPKPELCTCGHIKEKHTHGALACLCNAGIGEGPCPCGQYEAQPEPPAAADSVEREVAAQDAAEDTCATCWHYRSFHVDATCKAPQGCECVAFIVFTPPDGEEPLAP